MDTCERRKRYTLMAAAALLALFVLSGLVWCSTGGVKFGGDSASEGGSLASGSSQEGDANENKAAIEGEHTVDSGEEPGMPDDAPTAGTPSTEEPQPDVPASVQDTAPARPAAGGDASHSAPQHTHSWVPQTSVVHHEAQYQTVHHDAVYGTGVECNGCFAQFNSYEAWKAHSNSQFDNAGFDTVCTGYHTINVVVSPAWDEQVLISPAWDETVTTGSVCSGCGAVQ